MPPPELGERGARHVPRGGQRRALCELLLLHYFIYPSAPTQEVDNVISPIVRMRKLRR